MALAGLLAALRISGGRLEDQRLLFLGAGQAGIGTGNTIVAALVDEGVPIEKARQCCWFMDTKGLVVAERAELASQKQPYAHEYPHIDDFLDAVQQLRPTAIIGVSGQPGVFSEGVVQAMAEINDHPIIFALSNPTSKAECTAEQAYNWSEGRAIFASGSPFKPVQLENRTCVPGQGNNAYVFPGVGLGAVVTDFTPCNRPISGR